MSYLKTYLIFIIIKRTQDYGAEIALIVVSFFFDIYIWVTMQALYEKFSRESRNDNEENGEATKVVV